MALSVVSCILIGYLIGSLNPAYLFSRVKGYDIRREGSGNPGATNTFLLAGVWLGLMVALLDIFKAYLGWKLCAWLFPKLSLAGPIGGVSVVFGHMFPLFHRFRGGKGLACLGGLCLAHSPWTFLIMLILAAAIAFGTNYLYIMTVSMSVIIPVYCYLVTGALAASLVMLAPSPVIFAKHVENYRRMREGREVRMTYLFKRQQEIDRVTKE